MARSAKWFTVMAVILGPGALAGCATTQQKAARLRLNSARIVASQSATRVTATRGAVDVIRIAVVATRGRSAFVVTVRNPGHRAVSDLPISVGYRAGRGRAVYLNAAADLTYFDAHLPAITARGTLSWVYTAPRRLPPHARPFALVGATPAVPGAAVVLTPAIRARIAAPRAGDLVSVAVRNLSAVPQYQLPVYAVADEGGRTVAAGAGTFQTLAGDTSQTVRLRLLGHVGRSAVQVQAAPTIFH